MKMLEQLLNKYLEIIYNTNVNYIHENGYFNNSKIIDVNITPANKFMDKSIYAFVEKAMEP